MYVAPRTMSHINQHELELGDLKCRIGHCLTITLKGNREKKSRHLLSLYGKECYKDIHFTDEKIFTVAETFTKQNDTFYGPSSKKAHDLEPSIKRGHYPCLLGSVLWHLLF